jgi:hypothetical protein
MIANHEPTASRELQIEGDKALFVLRPGSITAAITKPPFRAGIFCICLVAGGGATPGARARGHVSRLRDSARKRHPNSTLLDIGKITRDVVLEKKLVVLIHGLFSTDVGTFGKLENLLATKDDIVVAGFPHNSVMSGIEENGHELAAILCGFRVQPKSVRFACHSRGGLVARSAATQLAKQKPWLKGKSASSILGGCAPFGTPHHGSPIAESPTELMVAGVLLTLRKNDASFASLLDVLSCYAFEEKFPGISDLRPPRHDQTYISKLRQEEGLYPDAHMPMYVVGGELKPTTWRERFASRPLDGLDHDFVVPTESALPRLGLLGAQRSTVNCDHFSYFKEAQQTTMEAAVAFLSS